MHHAGTDVGNLHSIETDRSFYIVALTVLNSIFFYIKSRNQLYFSNHADFTMQHALKWFQLEDKCSGSNCCKF